MLYCQRYFVLPIISLSRGCRGPTDLRMWRVASQRLQTHPGLVTPFSPERDSCHDWTRHLRKQRVRAQRRLHAEKAAAYAVAASIGLFVLVWAKGLPRKSTIQALVLLLSFRHTTPGQWVVETVTLTGHSRIPSAVTRGFESASHLKHW